MSQEKYIGMDVHQATISVAVMDAKGKLLMECTIETKAATILEFIQGLHGTLAVTFEEGTSAAWLHDLLKPHVSRLVVCDPRKNALLKHGNKNDRVDAQKLAELCGGLYSVGDARMSITNHRRGLEARYPRLVGKPGPSHFTANP